MSARILVVDDTPLNVKLLAAKLAKDYYVVDTAASGPEAFEVIQKDMPDIILLDIMMPGMDGFEVCKKLKSDKTTAHIPVIMITALSDVKDRVYGLECGADDFLTKPFNDTALFARVRSSLRLKMMRDEWRLRLATLAGFGAVEDDYNDATPRQGRVLLLEELESDRKVIEEALRGVASEVVLATTADDLARQASSGSFDLLLISLDLPVGEGLSLCGRIRAQESTRNIPVLLLANDEEVEQVAKGLDLGANDYLLRPIERSELVARVRTQFQQKQHYDRLKQKLEQNLSLALIDPLTGAYNRRYLDMHLPALFARCSQGKRPLSVVSLDLDHFKAVNDTHGHAAGDVVLKETVNRLQTNLRASDLVVRMGGEEFSIILPETELEIARMAAERLRLAIAQTPIVVNEGGLTIDVSASFGVAAINHESNESAQKILDRADAALYRAKETGRNKVVIEE
ncbi:MAG: PleD family two-component system response regulator [Bdellovibrionales bacterium]